ncbi:hypothetical protein B5S28_g829 [[Candida] boidinii]|uniref:Unnamed protein product n=1 Tax=Candida boidinii TaxID=5477 RepID=A0ACB5TRF7_CANBO|nr:hypothetical protein B5S28_g829 [[Candida] boidinii]OWB61186.1 hypothetical protein B5S29_g2071 [[Candida] boidinii]OWB71749.1 hypothetical protein B5S31_g1442 [[Candida] boidinii]OWB78358.1 hypothetical protein B5S32_g2550 [[Candida] boidinii]GME93792.1 unnamed protein product [[Candida] boidinii]
MLRYTRTALKGVPRGITNRSPILASTYYTKIVTVPQRQIHLTRTVYSSRTSTDASNTSSAPPSEPILKKSTLVSPLDDFNKTKVQNQQYSDNNNLPLFLAITSRAADKLNSIAKDENNPSVALRIKVESGGCHGFQYNLDLSDMKEYKPDEGDSVFTRDGANILIDKMSLEILRDSKIDYATEMIGSQFKVVDSPYTTSSCGCGSSFDFDFDKLNETSN